MVYRKGTMLVACVAGSRDIYGALIAYIYVGLTYSGRGTRGNFSPPKEKQFPLKF